MKLLDKAKIKYKSQNNVLKMWWKTVNFEALKIEIFSEDDGSWTYIIAKLSNFFEVEESKRMTLAYDMLKESWNTNGVKFAIDGDDDIIVLAETNDTDLTKVELETLLGQVAHACDTLFEIYPLESANSAESNTSGGPIDKDA